MDEPSVELLRRRVGAAAFERRMAMEACTEVPLFGHSAILVRESHLWQLRRAITWGVKALGLYERGRRNARAIGVRAHAVALPELPAPFIGLRILHLSDLHLLDRAGPAENILACLRGLSYDAVVITGDCCEETYGSHPEALGQLGRVIGALHPPIYACLGNHDALELTLMLERSGVRVLLNEHAVIERGGAALVLAGVDDAHVFHAADIPRALEGAPSGVFRVLLSHSAEVYREAEAAGVRFMLCGHTHGGQICLPGGIPIFYSARTPRSMIKGLWRYGGLTGYTSPGLGTSMIPVRLCCPAEAVVHVLERF